jgi:hypothetical protein
MRYQPRAGAAILLAAVSQLTMGSSPALAAGHARGHTERRDVMPRDEHPERALSAMLPGYVVVKVADVKTPVPGGTGKFAKFGVPSVGGGVIAFRADGDSGEQGVYALVGDQLVTVVDENTSFPGPGGGNFTFDFDFLGTNEVSVDQDGSVAFVGRSAAHRGIYTNRGGSLSTLVDDTSEMPGHPGHTFEGFGTITQDAGRVAFTGGSTDFFEGIYLTGGPSIEVVADTNTPVPGSTDDARFEELFITQPSVSGGEVVFIGSSFFAGEGAFRWKEGVLTKIADHHSVFPGSDPLRNFFSGVDVRDGQIVIAVSGGVYKPNGSGGFDVVASQQTGIPGRLDKKFTTEFFSPAIDDGGKVMFEGDVIIDDLTEIIVLKVGLYTDIAGRVKSIATRGTRLDGGTIKFVESGPDALSGGLFAFKVTYRGGGEGIYVAKPM